MVSVPGTISFTINEIGTLDQIDSVHSAGEGKTYYFIKYEFKGSMDNPSGSKIHPHSLDETGWDPAPQFVVVLDDATKYQSVANSHLLAQKYDYETSSFRVNFQTNEWTNYVSVWRLDKGLQPTFALKYIDPNGNTKFIKVKS